MSIKSGYDFTKSKPSIRAKMMIKCAMSVPRPVISAVFMPSVDVRDMKNSAPGPGFSPLRPIMLKNIKISDIWGVF